MNSASVQENVTDCISCETICPFGMDESGSVSSLTIKNSTVEPETGPPNSEFMIETTVIDVLPIESVLAHIKTSNNTVVQIVDLSNDGNNRYVGEINTTNLPDTAYQIDIIAENSIGIKETAVDTAQFEINGYNWKDETKYLNKSSFLITSRDWKDVLPLIPVTTWTDNTTIHSYPTLIFHEEYFPNKTITLHETEFLEETGLHVSWNFLDNILGENSVDGDRFTIMFDLTEDMYNRMKQGIPRGDMWLNWELIDPNGNTSIRYDIYFNGVKTNGYFTSYEENPRLKGAFWGNERPYVRREANNLTLVRTGGNRRITWYQLFTPYFATDPINTRCEFETDGFDVFDVCITDVQIDATSASPGDVIPYTVTIKNIAPDAVDFSNQHYRLQGPWPTPDAVGEMYKHPYSTVLSHMSTQFPAVILQPGESAEIGISLVFNKSDNLAEHSYDIDSIIYFLQQYEPDDLTIVGETPEEIDGLLVASPDFGAGIPENHIKRISPEDYFSYWKSYRSIVYVESNYEKALLASTYASLLNSPLIIQGTPSDTPHMFAGKKIICIGDVAPETGSCFERYSLEQLRQQYLNKTKTDKAILVNSDDLLIQTMIPFYPEKSSESISKIFHGTSLAAPILASSKHELIISTHSEGYPAIDEDLKNSLTSLGFSPAYLTVMSAPNAIPYKEYMQSLGGYSNFRALDQTQYSDFDNDRLPDVAVGRIQGYSQSDVTSLVARSIYYDTFPDNPNMRFMAAGLLSEPWYSYVITQANTWSSNFQSAGYNALPDTHDAHTYSFNPTRWDNQRLISYQDHGNDHWAGIQYNQIPLLDNSLVFNDACSTCSTYDTRSFCNLAMRQGAIAHMGAVGIAYTNNRAYMLSMNGIYHENLPVGESFRQGYRWFPAFSYEEQYRYMTTYFGDPTLVINPPHMLNAPLVYVK